MKKVGPLLIALYLCLGLALAPAGRADSAIGDWGHFLSYQPVMLLHNPDGEAFDLTVHVMQWGSARWNKPATPVKLTDPAGRVLVEGDQALSDGTWTHRVEEGVKGVYKLETRGNTWAWTSLERSVVWTGKTGGHMVEDRRVVFQSVVPRRWWFFVPKDVTEFTVRAQRADRYMSQREDWAFFVISPRGQRTNALVGQPPKAGAYRQDMVARVEVEPGAAGRFWAIEVGYGDSHNHSNINLGFEGVPPYLARSPEEWFDPGYDHESGAAGPGQLPDVSLYEPMPYIQATMDNPAIKQQVREHWPDLQHWSPSPSLGDPDGVQVLGRGTFKLWNPEGRKLGFRIGSYIPRTWEEQAPMARVQVLGPDRKQVLDDRVPIRHIHGAAESMPTHQLDFGKGVATVEVSDAERWFAYTYPATPLVLQGRNTRTDPEVFRFDLTVGVTRNWYFFVPEGTGRFTVGAACEHETDVIEMQVNSPDRTVAKVYGRRGDQTVTVPRGMDGKVWHLRLEVGSATRMISDQPEGGRYQEINLNLWLEGVPPYLAPTWEQWFDPEAPKPPLERGATP